MATAVPMGVVSAAPRSFLDDGYAQASSVSRSRDSNTPPSLRRSRSSLESLQRKRAQQSRLDSERPILKGGQQFRVGNVTSNGRLQLRPVGRDLHPHASPPLTPPYTKALRGAEPQFQDDWRGSLFTGSAISETDPPTNRRIGPQTSDHPTAPPLRLSRARSHSFSTIDDPVEPDRRPAANIKVLVNNTSPKPARTATAGSMELLGVSIPHYRLGTPHFSGKGSAILHSSINTGSSATDGFRFSGQDYDRIFPQPPNAFNPAQTNQRPRSSRAHYLSVDAMATQRRTVSSDIIPPNISQQVGSDSTILLELDAAPLNQNSRSFVRLSRASGQILAATPSGLIAQITSPSLLDYELLSDFFLTFRSYLTTHQLVGFLISRLQWAVSRSDDFGRIVRVRTFVALRHWILNYFVDDFVSEYSLRMEFCNLVNDLCYELQGRPDGGAGDLKIIGELKKCWRRTCALYWDVLEHKKESAADIILPGGRLGSRNSSSVEVPCQATPYGLSQTSNGQKSVNQVGPNAASTGSWFDTRKSSQEARPDGQLSSIHQVNPPATQLSRNRASDQSAHVVSCSITFKSTAVSGSKVEPSTGARPVAPDMGPGISSARLSPSLRKNSPPHHRRDGSFADALRDNRTTDREPYNRFLQSDVASSHPLSGSLVRGAMIQPTSPYVECVAPQSPSDEKSRFDFNFSGQSETNNFEDKSHAVSNPGMRRFLGNVRRALSNRQNLSQTHLSERKAATLKRSPRVSGLAVSRTPSHTSSGAPKRKLVGGLSQPRVDLLAVIASESFFNVPSDHNETSGPVPANPNIPTEPSEQNTSYRSQHLSPAAPGENDRILSDVTMGSRSIFIVDDTGEYSALAPRPITYGLKPNNSWIEDNYNAKADENRQTIAVGVEPESPMANRLLELGAAGIVTPPSSLDSRQAEVSTKEPEGGSTSKQQISVFERNTGRTISQRSTPVNATSSEVADMRKSYPTLNEPTPRNHFSQTGTADTMYLDRQPQLRRRPGGDLRAVDHVHSLGEVTSQRSFESKSSDSQVLLSVPQAGEQVEPVETTVEDQPTETPKKVSVLDTHSSQPMLHPAFEKEVAKLAQLPDDGDDGGIESTLRKLEGQVQTSDAEPFGRPVSFFENEEPPRDMHTSVIGASPKSPQDSTQCPCREQEVFANMTSGVPDSHEEADIIKRQQSPPPLETDGVKASSVVSVAMSDQSDSSTPLLERGMSYQVEEKRRSSSDWLKVSLPKSPTGTPPLETVSSPMLNSRAGDELRQDSTDSLQQISRERNLPRSSSTHKSFLLDDNQSLSGVLHDTRDTQVIPAVSPKPTRSFFNDEDDAASSNRDSTVPPHPLRHPETPPNEKASPFTLHKSSINPGPSLAGHITQQDREAFSSRSSKSRNARITSALELGKLPSRPALSSIPGAAHMPFILGFDSLLLAQQFTLVEKDALSEIDWRQLIDLRWNSNAGTCRTWADCLRPSRIPGKGPRFMGGVDLCITRFNIAVKWATSEIVLCEDLADRVACIVKYIHIARHARRLRNWSTMFQITMALVSADISRLKETWLGVPEKDREYLKTLEALITPTRNFHNLREEIESAIAGPPAPGTDGGCIPFIGIYTHDLIYNSQKPAYAQQPQGFDTTEQLINFERHRTAATIVKNLLRLIDASAKYPFKPVPDLLSRCLWMATLPDHEISQRSKMLEA